MKDSQKKKAPRRAPSPSYREIQLAILAELRLNTELLTTLCKQRGSPPVTADGLLTKSILEDEMKRRGVLRDTHPGTA